MTISSRLRKLASLQSEIKRTKFEDELARTLYYLHMGYGGPHPWGFTGRPPYPEHSALRVTDQAAGKRERAAIQKVLRHQEWKQMLRRLLRDVDTELAKPQGK